jgi:integrase
VTGKPLSGKGRRGRGEGTLEQRGKGVWRIRVYAGTDPVTGNPRQVSRTVRARTKTEALALMRDFLQEIKEGKVQLRTQATVGHLFDAHLEHLRRVGRAPATIESYERVIDKRLRPAFGHIGLRDLTAKDLDDYYGDRKAAGSKPATIRQHHSIMSGALTQAVKWGWRDKNPAAGGPPPEKPKGKKRIPVVEEVRKLIDAAGEVPEQTPRTDVDLAVAVMVTAVILLAITGCRRGEMVGLQWADVNWADSTLSVVRQRIPLRGGDATIENTKGEGDDPDPPVALGPLGLAVLREFRAVVAAKAAELEVPVGVWLLSKDCGRSPLNAKGFGSAITELGRKTGVPVTTHAFRRFAATRMIADGVDVVTAAGRLRHTPEMLLRVYAGFVPAKDAAAARGLEQLVLGPASPSQVEGTVG